MSERTILVPTGNTCNGMPICRERQVCVPDGPSSAPGPYAGLDEDWFLRGGERPGEGVLPEPPAEIPLDGESDIVSVFVCPECGRQLTSIDDTCECGWAPGGEDNPHDMDPCDECDGRTRCDDCPHNLNHEDEDEDEDGVANLFRFDVKMHRTKTVSQMAFVTVEAANAHDAIRKAEDLAESQSDGWAWEDVPESEDYEDCEVEDVEGEE